MATGRLGIADLTAAEKAVGQALKGMMKTFKFNEAVLVKGPNARIHFGVIAQDVEAVFPVAVRKRDDGKLAVDYEKLVAVAFQAIKELKAEVEALKK